MTTHGWRPAAPEDAPQIAARCQALYREDPAGSQVPEHAIASTEMGGEVCTIDELYVDPDARSGGRASALVQALMAGDDALWPGRPVALELEVTPSNDRARALYERLGFAPRKNATYRWRG